MFVNSEKGMIKKNENDSNKKWNILVLQLFGNLSSLLRATVGRPEELFSLKGI